MNFKLLTLIFLWAVNVADAFNLRSTPILKDDKIINNTIKDWSINDHLSGRYKSRKRFSCLSCNSHDCEDSSYTICHGAIKCYTIHHRDVDGFEKKSKGCVRDMQMSTFYCRVISYDGEHVHKINQESAQYASNCCNSNFCNNGTRWPELPDIPVLASNDLESADGRADSENSSSVLKITIAVMSPIAILFILMVIGYFCLKQKHKKKMEKISRMNMLKDPEGRELVSLRAQAVGDSTLRAIHEEDTSGSGFGMTRLVPSSLAKEIHRECQIGQGRYGQVWKGTWKGDLVAVKVFQTCHELSFNWERDIYETTIFGHENILGYIGSDLASYDGSIHYWLITQFYPNGSLFDFLNKKENPVNPESAHKLIASALKGLLHLHTAFTGTYGNRTGKLGIAHRDLKSKNILVKGGLNCVIADFGLAITYNDFTNELTIPENNSMVGTKRYMSPEVLNMTINRSSFDAFRQADMYSFALVMWEVLRRTDVPAVVTPLPEEEVAFALPFHQYVGSDPDFQDMREIVCTRKIRPETYSSWNQNSITSYLSEYMQECWRENPVTRLTCLRLKKSIDSLIKQEPGSDIRIAPVNFVTS